MEKFLKWINEPVDDEASQESCSHNNTQDTCTSSDSEEQDVSVRTAGGLLGASKAEPEKGQPASAAAELELEKSEGDGLVAAVADKQDCVTQDNTDSLQVETEGKTVPKLVGGLHQVHCFLHLLPFGVHFELSVCKGSLFNIKRQKVILNINVLICIPPSEQDNEIKGKARGNTASGTCSSGFFSF